MGNGGCNPAAGGEDNALWRGKVWQVEMLVQIE